MMSYYALIGYSLLFVVIVALFVYAKHESAVAHAQNKQEN